jgi:hypothetical protein
MNGRVVFRVIALIVIAWITVAPFLWRRNLSEQFDVDVPWDISALALGLSLVAIVAAVPLWRLQWRGSLMVIMVSLAIAVSGVLSTSPFGIGTAVNAVLLVTIASIPVALHSNNVLKGRRSKCARP